MRKEVQYDTPSETSTSTPSPSSSSSIWALDAHEDGLPAFPSDGQTESSLLSGYDPLRPLPDEKTWKERFPLLAKGITSSRKRVYVCSYCSGFGHTIRGCYQRKQDVGKPPTYSQE